MNENENKQPERRHVLGIKLAADDPAYLVIMLREMLMDFEANGVHGSLSAGSSGSYIVVYAENNDMTHDRYFEEMEQWLAARNP